MSIYILKTPSPRRPGGHVYTVMDGTLTVKAHGNLREAQWYAVHHARNVHHEYIQPKDVEVRAA